MVAEKVTPIIGRSQIYEDQYNEKNTPAKQLGMLQSTLLEIYSECYNLLAHTSKELSNKLRRAAHAILSPGKGTEMIEALKSLEQDLDRNVQLCQTNRAAASDDRAEKALQDLKQLVDANEKTLKNIESGVNRLLTSDDIETLNWISKVQYTEHHETIRDSKTEGTGSWILKHIDEWHAKDSADVL